MQAEKGGTTIDVFHLKIIPAELEHAVWQPFSSALGDALWVFFPIWLLLK